MEQPIFATSANTTPYLILNSAVNTEETQIIEVPARLQSEKHEGLFIRTTNIMHTYNNWEAFVICLFLMMDGHPTRNMEC
jgi:hypothetical protein